MRRTTIFAIAVLLLAATVMSAHAATITVTTTNDSGPGSLRQALANANNGDTINFAVTGAISLTSGGLGITKNVTISGPGANQLAVNGNQALFVFGVFPQKTVSISGLRIRNAQVGVYNNQGTVSVSNCALSGNSGAGLYNHVGASMTVANSNISNNFGTGAYNNQGTLAVTSCVLSDNSDAGIFNSGTVTVSNCALIGNSGGMTSFGTLTVSYCEISGNSGDGIFNGGTLTVSNCALSGNSGDGIGNRAFGTASLTVVNSNVSDNDGIGISNYVEEFAALTATIRSTTVSGNSAGGVLAQGGGVIFGGSIQVTVTDCTVSGNSFWGGIHATGLTNLTVTNSTISGNSANTGFPGGDSGGGIYGANLVENSTISGNSAATSGGGIYGGVIEIVNSTISGNSAGTSGGGIYNFPYSLNVANSTITGNSAPSGGGIYNVGSVEVSNTILNAGALGENIFNSSGTITSIGYNLSSDDGGGYLTGPGDQINTDPLLGPLQDNGGPTFTHALLPGSPAIDAGDPNFTPPPFFDQRGPGFVRVFNGRIDSDRLRCNQRRHQRLHQLPLQRRHPLQRQRLPLRLLRRRRSHQGRVQRHRLARRLDDSTFFGMFLYRAVESDGKIRCGRFSSTRESSFEVLTEQEWNHETSICDRGSRAGSLRLGRWRYGQRRTRVNATRQRSQCGYRQAGHRFPGADPGQGLRPLSPARERREPGTVPGGPQERQCGFRFVRRG